MQRSTTRSNSGRRAPRPLALVLTVAAAIIATGNIHAQVVVTDPTEESTSSLAASFAKVTAFAKQVQQYEQMLTSVVNLNMSSLIPNAPLQQISDPSSLIQAKCNGGSSGVVGALMTSLSSLISGQMDQSQKAICAQIVTTQVDKYNRTVTMMNQLNTYGSSLQTLQSSVSSFSNMGESSSTTTAAAGYSAQLQTEMSNWESQMKADDAIIKTLSDQQSILSQMALNGGGSSSIIGSDGLPDTNFQSGLNSVSTDVP